jgi:hypothetical protein
MIAKRVILNLDKPSTLRPLADNDSHADREGYSGWDIWSDPLVQFK